MVGALIADISAWTYENEQDTFWSQLIPRDLKRVKLSIYGHALLRAASRNVLNDQRQDSSIIRTSDKWSPEEWLKVSGQWLMWQLMSAWEKSKCADALKLKFYEISGINYITI